MGRQDSALLAILATERADADRLTISAPPKHSPNTQTVRSSLASGLADLTGTRVLAEIGDDCTRFTSVPHLRHPMARGRQASGGLLVFLVFIVTRAGWVQRRPRWGRVAPVGPPHPRHAVGPQQALGPVDQAQDPAEGCAQRGVVCGCRVQPGYIGVDQLDLEGTSARHIGEGEIRARCDVPWRVDRLGDQPEILARRGVGIAGQQPAQRHGLIGGYRHALAIAGVERADCVTNDQQAVGELAQPLVAMPHAGREPKPDRVIQRLGPLDRLRDVGEGQAGDEGVEAGRIDRRVVTEDAAQGEMCRPPSTAPSPPIRGLSSVAPIPMNLS
jgi:hypothetical protein